MGITDQAGSGPGARGGPGGYDRVTALAADGTETTWTRAQFEALSLLDRVRLLAGGGLRFFMEDAEVPPRSALSRD